MEEENIAKGTKIEQVRTLVFPIFLLLQERRRYMKLRQRR